MEILYVVGIVLLAIAISILTTVITNRIIIICYFKILDDYISHNLDMTKDLISWTKELDKHE